jgi:hypothetical protein
VVVARAMNELAFQVLTGNNWQSLPARSVQEVATVATQLLGVAIVVLVGGWLARRSRPSLDTLRAGAVLRAAYFVVPLGLAMYLVHAADGVTDTSGLQGYPFQPQAAAAIGAWTIVMLLALGAGLRIAARGQRFVAWLIATAGALVAADVAAFVAAERAARSLQVGIASGPSWFLRSYLPDGFAGLGAQLPAGLRQSLTLAPPANYRLHPLFVVVPLAGDIAIPLMLCGGFLVAYVLRRTASPAPLTVVSAEPPAAPTGAAVRPLVRVFAAAAAIAGVAIWAAVSALPDYRSIDNANASGVSYQERVTAILLVALTLMVMASNRTGIGIALSALLLVGDGVVARAGWSGIPVAIAMFAFGVAAAIVAWWVRGRSVAPRSTDRSERRVLAIAAIVAAAAIPTEVSVSDIIANHDWIPSPDGSSTGPTSPPALFAAVSVGLAVLLLGFALVAAWSSRCEPLSPRASTTFVVLASALLAVGILDAGAVGRALFWPDVRFFVQPVLIVVVLGLQRWTARSGVRAAALWCLAGVGAALASVAASQPVYYIGMVVTTPLLRAVYEGARPYDVFGSSDAWGHIVVGVALAALLTRPAQRDRAAAIRAPVLAASA